MKDQVDGSVLGPLFYKFLFDGIQVIVFFLDFTRLTQRKNLSCKRCKDSSQGSILDELSSGGNIHWGKLEICVDRCQQNDRYPIRSKIKKHRF
jgi:hypothetical protein